MPDTDLPSIPIQERVSLVRILSDSFAIWSRNFVLLYIFLLTPLLFSVIIPSDSTFSLDWRWLLLLGILFLMFSAILAGWLNMAGQACVIFFKKTAAAASTSKQPASKADVITPADAFKLFKAFLPGIGRYFPAITGGLFIQVGISFLVMGYLANLALTPLLVKIEPILNQFSHLAPTSWETHILALSVTQKSDLVLVGLVLLAAFCLYIALSCLCMLWPAFVVFYGDNPFKAYGRALMQYIRYPWPTIGFSGLFFFTTIILSLLTYFSLMISPPNFPFPYLICHLLFLSVIVYMAIACFVYLYHVVGAPPPDEEPSVEKNTDVSN